MRRLVCTVQFCSAICLGVALLVGCDSEQAESPPPTFTQPALPILNVYGPSGAKATLSILYAAIESTNMPFELRVFEGDSVGPGIQGVLDGTFDLMLLGRRPLPDEPLNFKEFVHTSVAFFVNPRADIHNLTSEQVAAVFAGELTNWSDLGGADLDIVLLFQEADDTNTEAIRSGIMQGKPFAAADRTLLSDQDVFEVVEGIPGAIGYAPWAGKKYVEFTSLKQYPEAIALDGVYPDDPAYALYSVIGVVYRPDREDYLQPLFDWGDRFVGLTMVQLLLEQFGLRLAPSIVEMAP